MSDIQFYLITGVPTIGVLLGTLVNLIRLRGLRQELRACREEMRTLRAVLKADS